MFNSLGAVRSKPRELVVLLNFTLTAMKWNVPAVFLMLPASRALGSAEHVANAVNVISGITGEDEYCLSVSGNGFAGSVRVGSDGRRRRKLDSIWRDELAGLE